MHKKWSEICICCRVSKAKFYLYHSTKIANARPPFWVQFCPEAVVRAYSRWHKCCCWISSSPRKYFKMSIFREIRHCLLVQWENNSIINAWTVKVGKYLNRSLWPCLEMVPKKWKQKSMSFSIVNHSLWYLSSVNCFAIIES